MKDINARNLAAALSYEGADIESALLELAAVAPALDAKVRAALYQHSELPKLRFVADRRDPGLKFVYLQQSRWVCAMHAVDLVTMYLDDEMVVAYLRNKFPEFNLETLCERGTV